VRVSSNADLRNLYASFGKLLNEQFSGWGVAFLCTDDHLATLTHLNFDKGLSLNNGGIAVKLNRGHVPA
jgi:23S rRNA G2445 N2-methylase RlmL